MAMLDIIRHVYDKASGEVLVVEKYGSDMLVIRPLDTQVLGDFQIDLEPDTAELLAVALIACAKECREENG